MTQNKPWLAVAALLFTAGCGGIGPGDYRVYRVAFEKVELAANCFESGAVPVDQQDDTSSLFQSGTFVLFVGADETFYLDTGTQALRGTETGEEDFTFSGESTDVDIIGDPMTPDATRTTVTTTSVTFNVEGQVVEGRVQEDVNFSCEGPACPDPSSSSCTRSSNFVGGEVADVQLKHEV